jgi:sugar phosphate isomerase/epimerase
MMFVLMKVVIQAKNMQSNALRLRKYGRPSMRISLHHLTVQDVSPIEMADIAAETGYDSVCLFVKVPNDPGDFPRIQSTQAARELRKKLSDLGLSVHNTDTCMIKPGVKIPNYTETLEIAAALGAQTFNIISMDSDMNATADKVAAVAEMAHKVGIQPIFEWFRMSAVKTLRDTLDLLRRTGRSDIELNVDVLHLIRNGELPADLTTVAPRMKRYSQISDGPLVQPDDKQMDEAVANRNFPGAGEFPLMDFVKQLPADGVVCIEAPVQRMAGTLSAKERASRNIEGARNVLKTAGR